MQSCPRCRVGQLKEVSQTYCRSIGKRLLVAPYAPANKCIICRYIEYDIDFLRTIDQMITPTLRNEPNTINVNKEIEYQHYYAHQENIKAI